MEYWDTMASGWVVTGPPRTVRVTWSTGVMPYSVPRRIASGRRKIYVRWDAIN